MFIAIIQINSVGRHNQVNLSKRSIIEVGSTLFHYGVIFVFFGHVAGVLIPKAFYDAVGITEHMYHFGAVWFGSRRGDDGCRRSLIDSTSA